MNSIEKSLEHWKQMRDAQLDELLNDVNFRPIADNCALCQEFDKQDCTECPLGAFVGPCDKDSIDFDDDWEEENYENENPWENAWHAFNQLRRKDHGSDELLANWRKAANEMVKVLEKLLTNSIET